MTTQAEAVCLALMKVLTCSSFDVDHFELEIDTLRLVLTKCEKIVAHQRFGQLTSTQLSRAAWSRRTLMNPIPTSSEGLCRLGLRSRELRL